jgi:hypothetical protein
MTIIVLKCSRTKALFGGQLQSCLESRHSNIGSASCRPRHTGKDEPIDGCCAVIDNRTNPLVVYFCHQNQNAKNIGNFIIETP